MTTPTNNDGWTSEPPKVAGIYEFRREWDYESYLFKIIVPDLYRHHVGLWRRLVPAVEVERAYMEGFEEAACSTADLTQAQGWDRSRAKKVMEGTEQ